MGKGMEMTGFYLNCGCGDNKKDGWINLDLPVNPKADIHCNLEEAKLPFDNDSMNMIEAHHVIEHIHNLIPLLNEFHRILKPMGILHLMVPEFPCEAAVADLTHVRYFVPATFTHLVNPNAGYDTSCLRGKWLLRYMESQKHDRPFMDRGRGPGSYFTEIEIEFEAIKNGNQEYII